MQRFLCVVLALCLASVAQAAICTVSGDPHWTTFDGCLHDFQGQGSFVHLDSPTLKVQANHLPCNSPHAVTCIRSVTTQVTRFLPRVVESVKFQWGIFYSPTVDPLYVNGELVSASQCQRGCNAPLNSTDPIAKFTFNGNTLVINTPDRANVTQGRFYLQVALPNNDNYFGNSNGLCGTHDGDASNEFTYPNGTVAFGSVSGIRFNGPATNRWAAEFAVGGPNFDPLADLYHRYDASTKQFYSVPVLQAVVIPTDDVQATLNGVNFPDPDKVNEIQDKCLALYPAAGLDSNSVKNCIYDAAALPDLFVLAASNQIAQASADSQMGVGGGSDSGLNRDQIIGLAVGLGLCGLIAVVVAGVLYYRLRKVSAAYQNALIVRGDNASSSAQMGSMRMSQNL